MESGGRGPNNQKHPRDPIPGLLAILRSLDPVGRQGARERLVAMGRQATESLIALLDDRHAHIRWEAAKALGEIRDPRAIPALIKALEDRDSGVRWLAAEGLVHLGRKTLPPLLTALLRNSDSDYLREGTHHVLHGIAKRDPSAPVAPVLKALRASAPDMAIPVAIHEVLEHLPAR